MYNINNLSKVAEQIEQKYSNVDLGNTFKTALFRSHMYSATKSLKMASELLNCEPEDLEPPESPNDGTPASLVIVVFSAIIILLLLLV